MMNTTSDKVVPTLLLDIRSLPRRRQTGTDSMHRVTSTRIQANIEHLDLSVFALKQ
jgi:hypothetical protein